MKAQTVAVCLGTRMTPVCRELQYHVSVMELCGVRRSCVPRSPTPHGSGELGRGGGPEGGSGYLRAALSTQTRVTSTVLPGSKYLEPEPLTSKSAFTACRGIKRHP